MNPFAGYSREHRPLAAYAVLAGVFSAAFAVILLVTKRAKRPIPERVGLVDLVPLGVATHKLSRLLTKDWVTSFVRAPFVELEGPGGPGEAKERPRGTGMRRAVGELLTCPFCLGLWVAAAFASGLVLAPRVTRLVASIFAMLTISDLLQFQYEASRKRAEQAPG